MRLGGKVKCNTWGGKVGCNSAAKSQPYVRPCKRKAILQLYVTVDLSMATIPVRETLKYVHLAILRNSPGNC